MYSMYVKIGVYIVQLYEGYYVKTTVLVCGGDSPATLMTLLPKGQGTGGRMGSSPISVHLLDLKNVQGWVIDGVN